MMEKSRRDFLKIAGVAAIGFSAAPVKQAMGMSASSVLLPTPRGASPAKDALHAKRWAMVVDVKRFTPRLREKCIKACHTAHNVPHLADHKHEIKWLWDDTFPHVFPGHENEHIPPEVERTPMLVLCNHCEHPPCVRVCPTRATFQRDDGIVFMDFHRCIGCRYCMAGCPYGSRSFNFVDPKTGLDEIPNRDFPTRMKGVVEKCNFCAERLAKGQYPACVEACDNNELIFGDLDDPDSEVSKALRQRFAIRRKPELGTGPQVYYII